MLPVCVSCVQANGKMDELRLAFFTWISAAFISAGLAANCFNRTDGVYEENCRSYTRCSEGVAIVVNCEHDEAFNTETLICEDKWKVPPPCGTFRDCSDKSNGFYADEETKCRSYYTCSEGFFFGHTLCPGDLVYNKILHVCDYVNAVPPPCGTNTTGMVQDTPKPIVT